MSDYSKMKRQKQFGEEKTPDKDENISHICCTAY